MTAKTQWQMPTPMPAELCKAKPTPWDSIDKNNTIAEGDKDILTEEYCKARGIHTEQLPEPYTGCKDSPVVCLNLNPGYSKDDDDFVNKPEFVEEVQRTLTHDTDHFLWTDAQLPTSENGKQHTGCDWWLKRTATLRKQLGLESSGQPLRIFVLEYFPYHTKKRIYFSRRLHSHAYRNRLLWEAMAQEKLIVIMRGKTEWEGIKAHGLGYLLKDYPHKIELASDRAVYLTPGNMPVEPELQEEQKQLQARIDATKALHWQKLIDALGKPCGGKNK